MSTEMFQNSIKYSKENIFDSDAQTLVNTVNTVGVMGKGIAKSFKLRYPKMFEIYREKCLQKEIQIGKLFLYKTDSKWILNFPTKEHWRKKSKIEFIELGLKYFKDNYKKLGITSVSFPPLGASNGGLDWENEVKPLMEKYLSNISIPVTIHLYKPPVVKPLITSLETILKSSNKWSYTPKTKSYYYKYENFTIFINPKSNKLSISMKDENSTFITIGNLDFNDISEKNIRNLFDSKTKLNLEIIKKDWLNQLKESILFEYKKINNELKDQNTKFEQNNVDSTNIVRKILKFILKETSKDILEIDNNFKKLQEIVYEDFEKINKKFSSYFKLLSTDKSIINSNEFIINKFTDLELKILFMVIISIDYHYNSQNKNLILDIVKDKYPDYQINTIISYNFDSKGKTISKIILKNK